MAFVAAIMAAIWILCRAIALYAKPTLVPQAVNRLDFAVAYAIGTMAAFWLIEGTYAFFV
ncbi:hypothetical protein ACKWRH_27630 [Bradyrhizobium sp. Pa8]|uniref:hypothetical protein n=1 Tax=Bradyrhizobium sp. Pa8 TaxID=3386552 RepID=UPI00403F0756